MSNPYKTGDKVTYGDYGECTVIKTDGDRVYLKIPFGFVWANAENVVRVE